LIVIKVYNFCLRIKHFNYLQKPAQKRANKSCPVLDSKRACSFADKESDCKKQEIALHDSGGNRVLN
jgi:hypothetical protein